MSTDTSLNLNAFAQQDFPFPGQTDYSLEEVQALRKTAQYLQTLCTQTGLNPEHVFPLELMAREDGIGHTADRRIVNTRFFALMEEVKARVANTAIVSTKDLERLKQASIDIFSRQREQLVKEAIKQVELRQRNFAEWAMSLNSYLEKLKEAEIKLKAMEGESGNGGIDLPKIVQEILKSGFFRLHKIEHRGDNCNVFFEIGPIHWKHKSDMKDVAYDVNFGTFILKWTVNGGIYLSMHKNNLYRNGHVFPYANNQNPWKSICTGDATTVYANHMKELDFVKAFAIIEEIFSKDTYGHGHSHPRSYMRGDTQRMEHAVPFFNNRSIFIPLEACNPKEAMVVNDYIGSLVYEDGNWSSDQNATKYREKVRKFYFEGVKGKYGPPDDAWVGFAQKNGLMEMPPVIETPVADGVALSTPVEPKKRAKSAGKKQEAPLEQPQQEQDPVDLAPQSRPETLLDLALEQIQPGQIMGQSPFMRQMEELMEEQRRRSTMPSWTRSDTPQEHSIPTSNSRLSRMTAEEAERRDAQIERMMRQRRDRINRDLRGSDPFGRAAEDIERRASEERLAIMREREREMIMADQGRASARNIFWDEV